MTTDDDNIFSSVVDIFVHSLSYTAHLMLAAVKHICKIAISHTNGHEMINLGAEGQKIKVTQVQNRSQISLSARYLLDLIWTS